MNSPEVFQTFPVHPRSDLSKTKQWDRVGTDRAYWRAGAVAALYVLMFEFRQGAPLLKKTPDAKLVLRTSSASTVILPLGLFCHPRNGGSG
jgi:hypothetical protein